MTNNNHPITPPPELVQQWANEYWCLSSACVSNSERYIAIQAARWGSDQELEACCEYLAQSAAWEPEDVQEIRVARRPRPKPPSLKEQALLALETAGGADYPVVVTVLTADQHALIRKALEALDD